MSRASEEAEGVEAYDYLLINDELDICVEELHEIIRSEHRRLTRQQNIEKIAKTERNAKVLERRKINVHPS